MRQVLLFALLLCIKGLVFGQNLPVIVEAESGQLGSKFKVIDDLGVKYATASEDFTGQSAPDDTSRMISFQVTFEESGFYQLYARVRVGSNGYNDDSFFAGKGFGAKNEKQGADWVFVNGLGGAGFAGSLDVVKEMGAAGSEVWKWVNISQNFFSGDLATNAFTVEKDSLTRTFQIGSREDGLDFDKFAFGKSNLYYTVDMLDKGLAGTETIPEPDSSNFYMGPPLADGSPKFLGNVKQKDDKNFANIWNQVTPGNDGKWGTIASSSDSTKWNWNDLDNLYKYATEKNIIFKDHTLIWGSQQPKWINSLSAEEQLMHIESWIRQVGKRYPEMKLIDVVNEPLPTHNPPDGANGRANYKKALGGDGDTGWDWVIKSFELARKYLPNTKLLLNDYSIINNNTSTTTYLEIISLLKERKLIDGIGVQGHRFEFEKAAIGTLKYNLDRLGETGLPVYITEFDLGNINNEGVPDDAKQLELYKKIFPVLWEHPSVHGITLWGYVENHMWQSSCYLTYADGSWRPAMEWLAQYIKDTPVEIGTSSTSLITEVQSLQNFPNPFSNYTNIQFQLNSKSKVSLKIFDIAGNELATLVDDEMESGFHNVVWNTEELTQCQVGRGVYFCRLITGNQVINMKMLCID